MAQTNREFVDLARGFILLRVDTDNGNSIAARRLGTERNASYVIMLDSRGREFFRDINPDRRMVDKRWTKTADLERTIARMQSVVRDSAAAQPDPTELEERLRHQSAAVRRNAVIQIGNMGTAGALFMDELARALVDRKLHWEAVMALARMGSSAREAATVLRKQLADPVQMDRRIIPLALMRIDRSNSDTLTALRSALRSPRDNVAAGAAIALSHLGSKAKAALPDLLRTLDRRLVPAYFAIEALGSLGPLARPALERLQKIARADINPKPFPLREAAIQALGKIARSR